MVRFLKDKGQFSTYIKGLIKEEMERQRKAENPDPITISPSVEEKVDEILELLKSGKFIVAESNDQDEETVNDGDELEVTEVQQNIVSGLLNHYGISKK